MRGNFQSSNKPVQNNLSGRGGFSLNNNDKKKPVAYSNQQARGGFDNNNQTENKGFVPPIEPTKNKKVIQKGNGIIVLKQKHNNNEINKQNETELYDENYKLNWDNLEKEKEYKPCEKLIKKLTKKKVKFNDV